MTCREEPGAHYVYLYFFRGIVVYIGKGCGARWRDHMRGKSSNERLRKLIALHAEQVTGGIVKGGLTETQAWLLESTLIELIGRQDLGTGTLLNRDAGGRRGGKIGPNTKARLRAAILARPDILAKAQASARIVNSKPCSETKKEAIRAAKIAQHRPMPERVKEALLAANKGRKHSPEHVAKCATLRRGRTLPPKSEETRRKISEAKKGTVSSRRGPRWEAQHRSDKHYFTGIPCKRGHVSKRNTCDGSCMECNKRAAFARYHDAKAK